MSRHGMSKTRLYNIWQMMRRRCYSPRTSGYERYGAVGIKVCDEWKHSFLVFREWAEENGYDDALSLDRKDNDGDYCPENCRWATAKEQANNRRNNRVLTFAGETHTMTEWAELMGLKRETLRDRIDKSGWEIERALMSEVA